MIGTLAGKPKNHKQLQAVSDKYQATSHNFNIDYIETTSVVCSWINLFFGALHATIFAKIYTQAIIKQLQESNNTAW